MARGSLLINKPLIYCDLMLFQLLDCLIALGLDLRGFVLQRDLHPGAVRPQDPGHGEERGGGRPPVQGRQPRLPLPGHQGGAATQ